MNARTRALALGLAIGLAVAVAPSCGPTRTCNASSCSTGCCDETGACQTAQTAAQCGVGGGACIACPSGLTCSGGTCIASGGGGGDGGGGGGGGGGLVAAFCHDYGSAYCNGLVNCKLMDSAALTQCISYFDGYECGLSSASVSKGYATFDSAKANACVQTITQSFQSCDLFTALDCFDSVVTPQSAKGQACIVDADCKDANTFCTGSGCARTCQSGGAVNQPCTAGTSSGCNAGLFCDYSKGSICQTLLPAGAACTQYDSCVPTATCDTGTSKCVALPMAGQPCRSEYPQCAANTQCDYTPTTPTCKALAQVGQSCMNNGCIETAYCDYSQPTWTCVARKAAGATCAQPTECQTDLGCKNGVCTAKSAEGGACTSYSDCASGLNCDGVTRTCRKYAYLGAGSTCTGDTQNCQSGTVCTGAMQNPDGGVGVTGTCTAPKLGDGCTNYTQCPSHAACSGVDGGMGTCVAGTLGGACTSTSSCPSGAYCNGVQGQPGTCVGQLAKGTSCTGKSDSECLSPWLCIGSGADGGTGTCGELGSNGQPCATGNNVFACKLLNECVNGTCQAYGLSGQPCSQDGMCLSGACEGAGPTSAGICGAPHSDGQPCSGSKQASVECTGMCDPASLTCITCQ